MIDLNPVASAMTKLLDELGIPCAYVNTKTDATKDIIAGFKTAGLRDEAIVNAYGVGAKILTLKAGDFTTAPEKYDTFQFQGTDEVYKAEAVHPIHMNAKVQFYKVYIKGR